MQALSISIDKINVTASAMIAGINKMADKALIISFS